MQRLIICGNLTNDPILNNREWTNSETGEIIKSSVCNFTVAVDEGYGARKNTEFFRVNAWRGLGDTCAKFLKKGRQVLIEGVVTLNNYVDKNNNPHSVMEVRADAVQFLNDGKGVETPNPAEPEEAIY